MKKEKELSEANRRLARAPFDYLALQQIADAVSSGYDVEIEVRQKDGSVIVVKRSKPQNQLDYEDFRTQYNNYHKNINK